MIILDLILFVLFLGFCTTLLIKFRSNIKICKAKSHIMAEACQNLVYDKMVLLYKLSCRDKKLNITKFKPFIGQRVFSPIRYKGIIKKIEGDIVTVYFKKYMKDYNYILKEGEFIDSELYDKGVKCPLFTSKNILNNGRHILNSSSTKAKS